MTTNETPANVPAAGLSVTHGSAVEAALYSAALARRFTHDEDWAQVLADEVRRLRMLLQQMLDVAENCDKTGYADGVGFVDIDKLHAQVREALPNNPDQTRGHGH